MSDELFTETLKVALYAKFGGRKTLQIAHLIDMVGADKVLIVNAERGLRTIERASKLLPKDRVISVTNLDELRASFGAVKQFATDNPDGWVCVDGMSQVMEWLANEQLSGAERFYDAKAQSKEPKTADKVYGRYLSDKGAIDTMRIYQRIGRDSENMLNSWIGLPCNLYVNYLEEMTGSGGGYDKAPPWGPDVPGKVGLRAVMSSFDFIGRLWYDEKGQLVAGFDSQSNFYMARTRDDRTLLALPPTIENFKLSDFVAMIQKGAESNAPSEVSKAALSG